ncbi:MAG: type II toxin-antitoxin system RelB/DinJ family antitoxin [Firmicutes bacterium]|nr:type II toxin-antitoxin system RelB/DinJ family antitoxin [Bacillota bacterium]
MAQTTVNVRVDEDVKRGMEDFCGAVGMNLSTAVNLFFKAVLNQRKIPFEIAEPDDPFYHGANARRLEKSLAEWNNPNIPKIIKTMAELEAMVGE